MLTKLSRPLRFQRLFNFSKQDQNKEFVFQTNKKRKRKNTPQNVETPQEPPIVKSESSKAPVVTEEQKRFEIVKRIYENNPLAESFGSYSVVDWLKNGGTIEDFACEKTIKYPTHINHWNPQSKEYVPAERYFYIYI